MRKLKLRIVTTILVTCLFSAIKTTFSENVEIKIPENIYNATNGNKSIVILKDKGTDGYGLFLLSDIVNIDETQLTLNNGTTYNIECTQKLKGYYTNNFLNFQLFPIDSETNGSNIINFVGGFYTNCKNGDQQYSGVYGHIKWTYKSGNNYPENIHEIRAGLKGEGNEWNPESSLKLVYNNSYYALSGSFQDYLAKNAIVLADFNEGISINYPDEYFNNTKAFSGNQNEIYFNNSGNNGFGLFFLGTGIENGPYEISDGTITLSCSGQLNGYYSFSFNDFGMLPLDQATAEYKYRDDYNISVNGGLYYNCREKGTNTIYTGVYGYVQRNYNYGNIHELRAGINYPGGKFIRTSPIEVIYSDNFRNTNRTLSGQYHDNLAKTSKTEARFFGDLGIIIGDTEIKSSGTLDDPYIVLPYETYKQAKIYIKSSKKGTSASLILTEFDNNGQTTAEYYSGNLNNERSNFGFYGYRDNIDFSQNASLKSGIINLALTNGNETWTQSIRFEIADPIIEIPVITINHTPECSTGIKVTATVTQNYGTFEGPIGYTFTGGNTCDANTTTNWIQYTQGQIISLPENGNNGEYICFMAENNAGTRYNNWQITGIDLDGPTFNLTSWTGEECTTGTIHIETIEQIGCANIHSNPFSWNFNDWSTNSGHKEYNSGIGTRIITGYVQDELGNWTQHTGTFTRTNTGPSIQTGTLIYPYIITGIIPTTLYTDLIASMGVIDGLCGASTISKLGNINCEYTDGNGNASWNENGISVTPPNDAEGTGTCTVRFADDEGSTISGTVIYRYDTHSPDINIIGPNPESCSTGKTISATISESGRMGYSTGNDINTVCNGTMTPYTGGTDIRFNSENDNGTYVCFEAVDLYENRKTKTSSIINNIDTTPPTFDFVSWTGNECTTGIIEISNATDNAPCAGLHQNPYSFGNGRLSTNTHSVYSSGVKTIIITGYVRNSLLKISQKTVRITREDQQITGTTEKNIGPISNEKQIDPIDIFGITGQGDCEIITVRKLDCTGATSNLINENILTITPDANTNRPGRCKITFTDGDTVITGTINFDVKTQEYPIVLKQIEGTETGELKILPQRPYDYINTGIVSAILKSGDTEIEFNNYEYKVIDIKNIVYSGPVYYGKNRVKSADFDVDLSIKMNEIDEDPRIQCTCTTGIFQLKFGTGFITDPAGNPSEQKNINTNNIYVAGNYLVISGGENARTENTTFTDNGFTITAYSKNPISNGTGSIICTGNENTCPGFTCDELGVTNVIDFKDSEGNPKPKYRQITLFGQTYMAPFYHSFNLKIDPIRSGFKNRTLWTGCTISIINNSNCDDNIRCPYSFTTINIDLVKRPIKAGIFGEENYRKGTLKDAINAGSGDDGFLFFITHPQNLVSGGALGNIQYTIHFSSGVADEFYYITGSAIVNGFKEDLNIKRPTYNYHNPRSYKFNFPEYP